MFDTNVIGAHVLTAQVATLLLKSSSPRVLFVTSDLGSLSKTLEPEYGPNRPIQAGWPKYWKDDWPGYRASKAAMNMLMRQWARFFEKDGVRVWAVNPGFCQTYLAGRGPEALKAMGAKDPAIAADFFRSVVEGERDADAGQYIELEGRIEW
jgi:NAD(P)-dependent dehydrogenase (short-subunit alcohol dehydrogenase family)